MKRLIPLALLLAVLVAEAPQAAPCQDCFAVVVLPDTQLYTHLTRQPRGEAHLDLITRWICEQRSSWVEPSTGKEMPIAMVIHLGDLVQTGDRWAISLVFVVGLGVVYGTVYGPLAAFWSELFDTRYRYTALSTLYQVSGILASGLTPLIAAWLVTRGDGTLWWVAGYNVLVAAISLVCARLLPETRGRGLDRESAGREDGDVQARERAGV